VPAFAYSAVDGAGKRLTGSAEAASAGALARTLEERGLIVIDVDAAEPESAGSGFGFGKRREVLEVTRAIAALLPAGMPLAPALQAASNVATGEVRTVLQAVRARVERGEQLSTALAAHPALFSPLYVGLVRAGEKSGDVDTSFIRLAEALEREEELRGKILSASIYPLLLASVGSIAIVVLLLFVLPRFVELLEGSGASLPTSTAILLNISTLARQLWPVFFLIPVGIVALTAWIRRTPEGSRAWSTALLTIPGVRTLRQYALAARFARLTGVLLGGGAPLLNALDDAMESLADPVARDDTARIRKRVREGSSLRQAISEGTLYPPLLAQLVAVGEESGRLQEFLLKAADIFEVRTERATQRLATLAEPAMIVTFGIIVAFVALSLLQAIYGVNATSFR
jgi:general secretion pathway protein F